MSGFELHPENGGEPIALSLDKITIGRGPFLQVKLDRDASVSLLYCITPKQSEIFLIHIFNVDRKQSLIKSSKTNVPGPGQNSIIGLIDIGQ